MACRLTVLVPLCLGLVVSAARAADGGLPDPTRPVIDLGATSGGMGTQAGSVADSGVPAGPRLQSIIRPAQGAPRALIDGQLVAVGGRVGDARLLNIGEDSVALAGSAGRQVLRLTPQAEKRPHRDGALRGRHGEKKK